MSNRMLLAALLILLVVANGPIRSQENRGLPHADFQLRTVTLDGTFSLRDALKALHTQTGNVVEDRRREAGDLQLSLKLENVSFWQAVDAIAREAKLQVSLYAGPGKVALVDGPAREFPICYSGLFRIALKRITVSRDLETGSHQATAQLEVAWEPRFQAFYLESRPGTIVQDDQGKVLRLTHESRSPAAVAGRPATDVEVRFTAPPRSVQDLGLLQGQLVVLGAGRVLTFSFADFVGEKGFQPQTQTQDGVTVQLAGFSNRGEVRLKLQYPDDSPQLESYQSVLDHNEIRLIQAGRPDFPANGGSYLDEAGNHATAVYHFQDDRARNLVLGKPGDWTVQYRTPGRYARVPIRFEFRNIPLP